LFTTSHFVLKSCQNSEILHIWTIQMYIHFVYLYWIFFHPDFQFFFLWIDVEIFWKDVYIFPPSLNVSEIDSNESDQ
jgi:hypothetical protein